MVMSDARKVTTPETRRPREMAATEVARVRQQAALRIEHMAWAAFTTARREREAADRALTLALAEETSDPCCWACVEFLGVRFDRMMLCKTCGNKRCPKANDHKNKCTNSNEPGQEGSAYP